VDPEERRALRLLIDQAVRPGCRLAFRGKAGMGTGIFTYGGETFDPVSIGFSIHCSLATHECRGGFYVAPISLSGHGNALTILVSGTISSVGSGTYRIALDSPDAVAACTLTNAGTAPGGATPTQFVNVICTGNGTTTLSGQGTPTGIVNVTGP
jgi:hypothetical protein